MARKPCRSLTTTAHAHRTRRHDALLLDCPTRRRVTASAAAGAGQPLRFGEYRRRGCHRGCGHRRERRLHGAGLPHRRLRGAGGVGRHRSRDHTLTRSAATRLTSKRTMSRATATTPASVTVGPSHVFVTVSSPFVVAVSTLHTENVLVSSPRTQAIKTTNAS